MGIRWNREGVLVAFHLAKSIQLGGFTVPAGSSFTHQSGVAPLPARWSCLLAATLRLPEVMLEKGDIVSFDRATGRLLGFWLPGARPFGNEMLVSGPIALLPGGFVECARARKFGYLQRRE